MLDSSFGVTPLGSILSVQLINYESGWLKDVR